MAKRENLSDQLNKYNKDEESLCGINFAIHKNVMVWGGTIIQLSNISSISQYNSWENKEEKYFDKVEKSVSFKEFKESNLFFKYAFWGAIACLVIGFFKSIFLILFLALGVLTVGFYLNQRKKIIDVPKMRMHRICHYMICITMNSTKKYDFEIKTEEFRNKVMIALYQRIVEQGNNAGDIQIDLKNCNIVTDSVVNGGQVLLGDENENNVNVEYQADSEGEYYIKEI